MNEINTSTGKLSLNDALAFARTVKTALSTGQGLIIFAAVDPSVETLDSAIGLCQAAADKETSVSVTIERHERRADMADILVRMGMSCMLIADGDLEKLSHSGFPLRKTPEHTHAAPPAPADLRLANGPGSGTVTAKVKPAEHAISYEVQSTADAMTGPWVPRGTFTNSQNMPLHDLTPLTMVFVRARGVGSNGPGDWSDIAEIAVV